MAIMRVFHDEWLVDLLLRDGAVTLAGVNDARDEKEPFISQCLVDRKLLREDALLGIVERAYGIRSLPSDRKPDEKLPVSLVSERLCRRHMLLPLRADERTIEILTSNPLALEHLEDVRAVSSREPVTVYALPKHVRGLVDAAFSRDSLILDLVEKLGETDTIEIEGAAETAESQASEELSGPVIQLVNALLVKAARLGASDLHIEHDEGHSVVRIRIDGVLREIMRLPPAVGRGPVVSRLKIMSAQDVADRMRAKDGRLRLIQGGRELMARLSFLPASFGEEVVMRIVDKDANRGTLDMLGLSEPGRTVFERLLARPQGMTVFTGPTGSGKSTSAYAALKLAWDPGSKLITVEDPVEHRLPGATQVQVNVKQGLGFEQALRAVLRQDPDIVMVGEMRDAQTSQIAFQAAVTGHLVVSTLHTNDAISTLARLLGLGIEPFQIASGLNGVISQRLVRRLCDCRVPVPADELLPSILESARAQGLDPAPARAEGCDRCGFTGYRDRVAIAETLEMTPAISDLINAGAPAGDIRSEAVKSGALRTLFADLAWHVAMGSTTFDEVKRYVDKDSLAGAAVKPAAAAKPAPVRSGKPRVIVVDDDDTQRRIAGATLARAGYEVELAASGIEALKLFARAPTDLLVLDLEMPHLDGLATLGILRGLTGGAAVRTVIMTADGSEAGRQAAKDAGCDDYLVKPTEPLRLVERVKAVLNR